MIARLLAQLVMYCGMVLAVIVTVFVAPLGIAWDVLANPAARRASCGRRGSLLSLTFNKDSWYARLYLRAYGEDRGWIVTLRRLFCATGFSYGAMPTLPMHKHQEGCATCSAFRVEDVVYRSRRAVAYDRTLAFLRSPPDEQPFNPNGRPVSRCPVFWKVAAACVCYVLGVALRRQVLVFLAFAIVGVASGTTFVVVHGVRGIGALAVGAVRITATLFAAGVRRYGRTAAFGVAAGLVGLVGYGVAAGAMVAGRWYHYEWQPAHIAELAEQRERAAYACALEQAEEVARPEMDAHAVQRAIELDAFETRLALAAFTIMDERIRTDLEAFETHVVLFLQTLDAQERTYSQLEEIGFQLRGFPYDLRYLSDNWQGVGVAAATSENAYPQEWYDWWRVVFYHDAFGIGTSSAFSTPFERTSLVQRVSVEVEGLLAVTVAHLEARAEHYSTIRSQIVHKQEALFSAVGLREVEHLPADDPRMLTEWVDARCLLQQGAWFYKNDGPRVCIGDGSWEDPVRCATPVAVCAAVMDRYRAVYQTGKDMIAQADAEATARQWRDYAEYDERRRAIDAHVAQVEAWLRATLASLRDDPTALVAELSKTCYQEHWQWDSRWYAHEIPPFGVSVQDYTDVCERVAASFADEIAGAEEAERVLIEGTRTERFVVWAGMMQRLHGVELVSEFIFGVLLMSTFQLLLGFVRGLQLDALLRAFWRSPMAARFRAACAWPFVFGFACCCALCRGIRDAALFLFAFMGDVKDGACQLVHWE
ncbi:MAG: hypothetical protein Q7S96_00485 [bacterium]|nr:hypothetical protein [bacterium]